MLAQDQLIQFPRTISSIQTLDLNRAIDSIFIIQALLVAIVKDCTISVEMERDIRKLKQEITFLENTDRVTDLNFSHIDGQFYCLLSNAKGFQRLANIIAKEKSHIDRIIKLFVQRQESYKLIVNVYKNVLNGIQFKNTVTATNALLYLAKILEEHVVSAEQKYPEYFQ